MNEPVNGTAATRGGWNAALGQVVSQTSGSRSNLPPWGMGRPPWSPEKREPAWQAMLIGTVTPGQVRRGLAEALPAGAVEPALATLVHTRAAGGRALRALIREQERQSAPGGLPLAQQLIGHVLAAEPGRAAGPAVRSLLRAYQEGRLNIDDAAGDALLRAFFAGNGYHLPSAAGSDTAGGGAAGPNKLPGNITEADQEAARLLARASGAWHLAAGGSKGGRPKVAYPKPAQARVKICVIDNGFNLTHPVLAPKSRHPSDPANVARVSTSPLRRPSTGYYAHGTLVAAAACGSSHVTEMVPLRQRTSQGTGLGITFMQYLAAGEANIVNISLASFGETEGLQRLDGLGRVSNIQEAPEVLFVQAAGNRNSGSLAYQEPSNLALSGEPNVLTVGGFRPLDELDPETFVYDPQSVHTLAPGVALVPKGGAAAPMEEGVGSSVSAPLTSNLAAVMSAQAPHLQASRMKGLIEATSAKTPAWEAANPKPSAFGMVDRGRAQRLAAVAGLVVSGTAGALRTITRATAGGAVQVREQGPVQVRPGMTAAQAADVLRLTGAERTQALADHAALCAGAT